MDNLLFENGQKNVHTFYWGAGKREGGIPTTWYLNKNTKQNETGKTNFCTLLQSHWFGEEGLCDIWEPMCKSLSISYHPPSSLLSLSLPQTLQKSDPNKVKSKQFSHHKPYYSVYPGVLPCRFI